MLRAGIIGCGGITERRHAPALAGQPGRVELAALADLSEERTDLIGESHGVPPEHCYRDYAEMLERESLDLVNICTPHRAHEEQTIAALEGGAHVFLEKPMATSLEEADRMIAASRRTGKKLTVCHNQRFCAAHRASAGQIRSGAIGDVFLVRFEGFSGSHVVGRGVEQHWRTQSVAGGGGPLIDNGYHQAYRAVDWVGSPAKRVFARIARCVQDIEVEDSALLLVEHESGATTSLQVGWCARAGSTRVQEALGTEGQIRLDGSEGPVAVWQGATRAWTSVDVEPEGPDELGFPVLLREFLDCIEGDGPPPVTAQSARHILALIVAAYESGRTGRVVEVDPG